MRRMLLLTALSLLASGCGSCAPRTGPVDAGPERGNPDETVQPVYAVEGAPLPEAVKLCAAIHELPEARAAACCQRPAHVTFAGRCADVLSAALRGGHLALDPARAEACIADIDRLHAGCEWIGPWAGGLPASCERDMIVGKLASGAPCRSTLECAGNLRCLGSGPTDPGVCGPPRDNGGACRLAVDSLAPLLGLDIDRSRPECAGMCDHHRCRARLASGAACVVSDQCPQGERCLQKRCAPGRTSGAGEACSGDDCVEGLRCVEGRCMAPRPSGAACAQDAECSGRCARGDGGGVCVMGC